MMIVCPIARPENERRVLDMWAAQTRPASLLFVPAPGVQLSRGTFALRTGPESTIGGARNVGIDYTRMLGGHEWTIFWDDDNYYGPGYVEDVLRAAATGVELVSKGLGYVRHDSGLWKYESAPSFYPGHSLSVVARYAHRFPEISLGEDVEWSRHFKGRAVVVEPTNLIYDRRGKDHAYPAGEAEFRAAFGAARNLGDAPDELVHEAFDVSSYPLTEVSDEAVFGELEASIDDDLG